MPPESPEKVAIRLRLYDDFDYYAPNVLKIRTKESKIVPFKINEAQRRLAEVVNKQYAAEKKVRVIILKARQMGLSTWVGGRLFSRVSQRRARKAMVIAHEAKSTRALFDMTKRFYDLCPPILQPQTKYASQNAMTFGVLDSGYVVATAGGDSIGRGETLTHVHASELAFWPKSSALANFNGLMQSVPNAPDTEVYIESTANGVSGLFYDTWMAAVRGTNGFIPVFLPWYIEPAYRDPIPRDFRRIPSEIELAKKFGLDNGQLAFRRRKVAETSLAMFQQEYPCTPEEAFLTTGRPVFNPDRLQSMTVEAREQFTPGVSPDAIGADQWPPLARMALEGTVFAPHSRGELYCFRAHEEHETYFIGADVGAGINQDWSVAQVLDSQRRQVAVWRGQAEPDFFATVLYHLGNYYNEAKVIVERNNHGILTNRVLVVDHGYTNYYTEVSFDKITDTETEHVGFLTSQKSKPLIIDKLRAEVREGTIEILDPVTLAEMKSFIVTSSGKMEAEKGCHDDTVMALALANHINDGGFTPLANTDAAYASID